MLQVTGRAVREAPINRNVDPFADSRWKWLLCGVSCCVVSPSVGCATIFTFPCMIMLGLQSCTEAQAGRKAVAFVSFVTTCCCAWPALFVVVTIAILVFLQTPVCMHDNRRDCVTCVTNMNDASGVPARVVPEERNLVQSLFANRVVSSHWGVGITADNRPWPEIDTSSFVPLGWENVSFAAGDDNAKSVLQGRSFIKSPTGGEIKGDATNTATQATWGLYWPEQSREACVAGTGKLIPDQLEFFPVLKEIEKNSEEAGQSTANFLHAPGETLPPPNFKGYRRRVSEEEGEKGRDLEQAPPITSNLPNGRTNPAMLPENTVVDQNLQRSYLNWMRFIGTAGYEASTGTLSTLHRGFPRTGVRFLSPEHWPEHVPKTNGRYYLDRMYGFCVLQGKFSDVTSPSDAQARGLFIVQNYSKTDGYVLESGSVNMPPPNLAESITAGAEPEEVCDSVFPWWAPYMSWQGRNVLSETDEEFEWGAGWNPDTAFKAKKFEYSCRDEAEEGESYNWKDGKQESCTATCECLGGTYYDYRMFGMYAALWASLMGALTIGIAGAFCIVMVADPDYSAIVAQHSGGGGSRRSSVGPNVTVIQAPQQPQSVMQPIIVPAPQPIFVQQPQPIFVQAPGMVVQH